MAESTIGTEVNGTTYNKNVHTFARTIGGTAKEDMIVLLGEPALPTYTAVASAITTTSASHLFFLQGDGTLYTRVNWFEVSQQTMGTAAVAEIRVYRTTTAGSGGGAISCYPTDGADTSPYAGTAQTLPSSKGTEGVLLHTFRLPLVASTPTLGTYRWERQMYEKPWIIAPATTNGLCWKLITGIATDTLNITVGFSVSTVL